ncbi:MAG: filamentous hemagglutinin family protein [Methylovirgula sp.]
MNGATLSAPAGNVSLEATATNGDLNIASGSLVSSQGVAKLFFDVTEFAPAGNITLTADHGSINVASGSTLNFAGAQGGGAAGSLTLSAPDQVVNLNGTILGSAAAGYQGGSFSLNTGGSVDLDNLASELAASGVTQSISVQTNAGNLILSPGNSLTAHVVSLTADGGSGGEDASDGNIVIDGTINASGNAGGIIDLYGKSGVDLEGSLIATASGATEQGGTIEIGTVGVANKVNGVVQIDPNYGYEEVSSANSGTITLGANAKIEVWGGVFGSSQTAATIALGNQTFATQTGLGLTPGQTVDVIDGGSGHYMVGIVTSYNAASGALAVNVTNTYGAGFSGAAWTIANPADGGTISLRAPLLADDGVNVNIASTAAFTAPSATTLEAFAVWSTDDPETNGAAEHFDGIVDPAGWYTSAGTLVSGTFTEQSTSSTPPTFTFTPDANGDGGGSVTSATGVITALSQQQVETGDSAIGFGGLQNDFFVPLAGQTDTAHQVFYGYQSDGTTPGTLMGFVENFPISASATSQFANVANFSVTPGIELDNPDSAINSGNISILTNWNLGAGSSPTNLAFRFNEGGVDYAPVITFRAENDVKVDASLSDGFFQVENPTAPPLQKLPYYTPTPGTHKAAYNAFYYDSIDGYNNGYYSIAQENSRYFGGALFAPSSKSGLSNPDGLTDTELKAAAQQYYGLYEEYLNYLLGPARDILTEAADGHAQDTSVKGEPTFIGSDPSATAENQNPNLYAIYFSEYEQYAAALDAWVSNGVNSGTSYQVAVLQPPPSVITGPITSGSISSGTAPTDNTPSPISTSTNALPLQTASLIGGFSTSFRLVAGSNLTSADPLALQAAAVIGSGGGSVTLDGHFSYVDMDGQTISAPTMIRTGTGSIDIAAADDVTLADTTAPGVIYTAGEPATGAPPPGSTETINSTPGLPDVVVTSTVNPDSGGDISILAQNNITGIEDVPNAGGWLTNNNPTNAAGQITQTSINFGAFDQGVMSVGGNVSISAGGDITHLAVSLPTTWYKPSSTTFITVGGGNLTVTAGGNILSGDYLVADGTGSITAGGQIGAAPVDASIANQVSLGTLFATQDGVLNVSARQGANIGGVSDPIPLESFSPTSALNISSTTGDIDFGIGGEAGGSWPATFDLIAFNGGITVTASATLAPSPTGELSLIADQSINISGSVLDMSDESPSDEPSPTQPNGSTDGEVFGHDATPLHASDTQPVRIYSLTGSIVDGVLNSDSQYLNIAQIIVGKPAEIQAGQNILNLAFAGQNLRDDDVTSIIAGRDISDSPNLDRLAAGLNLPGLDLGGPGTFDIEAGRNIGPLTPSASPTVGDLLGTEFNGGIVAMGNTDNPFLPHESANIQVLFGTGPGVDTSAFVNAYIAPGASVPGVDTSAALIAFMEQYDEGTGIDTGLVVNQSSVTLTEGQAWAQFQTLPQNVQRLFAEDVLSDVLTAVGNDYNNAASPFFHQYSRGYQAINTLFPASFGYTANDLNGGTNGANSLVSTGNLDIRSTTIQTQQSGNVSIFGPGGEALVGSESAPPATGDAVAQQGILTLEQGDVDIFTDQSLLLAQSRVFTEEGGDMTIWSSNGDINAGKGAKTVTNVPAPIYISDEDHYNTRDARGEVSGAGISTVPAIPGVPPGTVDLIAPRGTVDAGAAGIRVSGNLNIAALQVLNAFNIQVQGVTTGVPTVAAPNVGALSDASAASGAATKAITSTGQGNSTSGQPSILIVEIEGYGGDDGQNEPVQQPQQEHRKKADGHRASYDPNGMFRVVGNGELTGEERENLTQNERQHLAPR